MQNHPKKLFALTSNNSKVIPLKLVNVIDDGDGYFTYKTAIDAKTYSKKVKLEHKLKFQSIQVDPFAPIDHKWSSIRLTYDEAVKLGRKRLTEELNTLMRQIKDIQESIDKVK